MDKPIDIELANANREWRRSAMPGSSECPACGAMLMPEDCEALHSCESCGWLGQPHPKEPVFAGGE